MKQFICSLETLARFDPPRKKRDGLTMIAHRGASGGLIFRYAAAAEMPVRIWQDPTGSFVALDGDLFGADGGAPERPSLDALFARIKADPAGTLASLNGTACVVAWNALTEELIAARDRYGQSHVFFSQPANRLIVASNLPALLNAGANPCLDLQSLDCFLARGVLPAPLTFVAGIRKLGPGEYLRARPGEEPTVAEYFRATARPRIHVSAQARASQLKERLLPAISRRRAPSGPTAMLLSSGVDSAVVLACLVKDLGGTAEAFTFGYRNYSGSYNESERARALADHLETKHHTIECGPQDVMDWLPRIARSYGEPLSFGLHSFMSHAIKERGLSAALTGVGADCFGISDSGLASVKLATLPHSMRRVTEAACGYANRVSPYLKSKSYAVLWANRYGLPSCLHPALMHDDERQKVYADKTWSLDANRRTLDIFHKMANVFQDEPAIARWSLTGQRCFTSEGSLFWNNIWGRSFGLQMGHPFLDNDVHQLMMRLGRPGHGKTYIRELAQDLLPAWVARAPKIHQTIPIGHWFRGPLRELLEGYLTASALGDLFDMRAVESLKSEHMTQMRDHTWRLWALLSVSAWRTHVLNDHRSESVGSNAHVLGSYAE